ncbi:hypothetical protein [Roseovarius aestuariivivens]|uniref:hypothetical protein n=1 Tax=Roseovarius aestuariivivens TaxID=1888910 RepID=UPI001081902E|nr:hypothetical protein [Roseovarius aestuariivivens]
MACLQKAGPTQWRTVSLRPTATGLTARERFDRFKVEAVTEMSLRAAGVLMVAAAILLWFLVPAHESAGTLVSHGALGSIMAAGGLAVFAYGTRGFRRQMSLDLQEGTLSLTKININDQARVARQINLGEIESVFLNRPAMPGGLATLLVRVTGSSSPAIALTGITDEIETVHQQLCAVMKTAQRDAAPKPSLRLRDRPPPKRKLFSA